MRYYSTKNPSHLVDLKEAVLRSLPADNGLYMPEVLEPLPQRFWNKWRGMSFAGMSFEIARHFLRDAVPAEVLREIIEDAVNFDAPLVELSEGSHVLELFHGPTLAFKDFGARFMARLMAWLTRDDDNELTVLVATSGDTGGAVASAFYGVEGTRVVILYPQGGVSALQEKQLTALGGNIHALEVEGSFDDCQRMVKECFLDRTLAAKHHLTSANSINIARLLPQSFYYFHAARQLLESNEEAVPTFVVPSGNFGNLTAGLLAREMGLQVENFVAATNLNDVVPRYLAEGEYEPRSTVQTISNAMDVGAPSNFARLQALFGGSWEMMRENVSGLAFDDEETREGIRLIKEYFDYVACPHTAVAWLAAQIWKKAVPDAQTVILSTAHPSKFDVTIEQELGAGSIEIPERLACLAHQPKVASLVKAEAAAVAHFLNALE